MKQREREKKEKKAERVLREKERKNTRVETPSTPGFDTPISHTIPWFKSIQPWLSIFLLCKPTKMPLNPNAVAFKPSTAPINIPLPEDPFAPDLVDVSSYI